MESILTLSAARLREMHAGIALRRGGVEFGKRNVLAYNSQIPPPRSSSAALRQRNILFKFKYFVRIVFCVLTFLYRSDDAFRKLY